MLRLWRKGSFACWCWKTLLQCRHVSTLPAYTQATASPQDRTSNASQTIRKTATLTTFTKGGGGGGVAHCTHNPPLSRPPRHLRALEQSETQCDARRQHGSMLLNIIYENFVSIMQSAELLRQAHHTQTCTHARPQLLYAGGFHGILS